MRDMNKVIFTGRLTADPELRYITSTGTPYVGVSVAINSVRGSGDQKKDHVDFIDIACYKQQAENVAKYLKKGSPVLIEGRLAQQRWDDKASGQKRSKVGVIADHVQFLNFGKREGQEFNPGAEGGVPDPVRQAFPGAEPAPQVAEDDIPF